jgi:hypothetical protein
VGERRDTGGKVKEFVSVIEKLIDRLDSGEDPDEEIDIETCPTQPMQYPDHLSLALRPQIQEPVGVSDLLESSTAKERRPGSRTTTAKMRPGAARPAAEAAKPLATRPQRPAHLTKLPPPPPPPSLHEVDNISLAFESEFEFDDDDESLTDTEIID